MLHKRTASTRRGESQPVFAAAEPPWPTCRVRADVRPEVHEEERSRRTPPRGSSDVRGDLLGVDGIWPGLGHGLGQD